MLANDLGSFGVWEEEGEGGARFRAWQFHMHLVSNPDFPGWFGLETDM